MGGLIDAKIPPPLELPPQPQIRDFTWDDLVDRQSYKAALESWERVCADLTNRFYEAVASSAFWGGR